MVLALLLGSGLVCGCSAGGSADDDAKNGTRQVPFKETVVITKMGFHPRDAEVLTGGSITWVNRDPDAPHTAETKPGRYEHTPGDEDASFDTHTLFWGEPYTVTFHKPGTYSYGSSYDFGWKGTVSVIDRALPRP
jgi:plastocyanin